MLSARIKLIHDNWQEDTKSLRNPHDQRLRQCRTDANNYRPLTVLFTCIFLTAKAKHDFAIDSNLNVFKFGEISATCSY